MNFGPVQFNQLQILLGLTPRQRWDALISHQGQPGANQLYMWIGILLFLILTVWLFVLIYRRKISKPSDVQQFNDIAEKKALTDREYRILMDIAAIAELKQSKSIFTLPSAFNRAAEILIHNTYRDLGELQGEEIETELGLLQKKIGFEKFSSSRSSNTATPEKQTSFQIPVKKKLYINQPGSSPDEIEAIVVANTSNELTIELKRSAQITFGNPWICRYYIGSFVAEFQTTPLRCSGNVVALKHSHHIRMVNRRRFMRVPVNNPAYIAHFPFKRNLLPNTYQPRRKLTSVEEKPKTKRFEPPAFTKATVSELGGPGLRIETDLDIKVGDRLLVIFMMGSASVDEKSSTNIIEGVVRVRHVTKQKTTVSSAAVEFENLNDNQINELVQAANRNMISMKKRYNTMNDSDVDSKTSIGLQPV